MTIVVYLSFATFLPADLPDCNLIPQATQSSLWVLTSAWFYVTSRGGPRRPIMVAAMLPEIKGKVSPNPMVARQHPQMPTRGRGGRAACLLQHIDCAAHHS